MKYNYTPRFSKNLIILLIITFKIWYASFVFNRFIAIDAYVQPLKINPRAIGAYMSPCFSLYDNNIIKLHNNDFQSL